MIPSLGPQRALELHLALLEDSIGLLVRAAAAASADPFIAYSEPWEPERSGPFGSLARAASRTALLPQRQGDLGVRLRSTCADLFGRGAAAVVVFGSDSPTLPPERLQEACARLRGRAEVVIGPSEDGGYYLIGLSRPLPALYEGIPWGSSRVLEVTLRAVERAGACAELLPTWYDIDRPRDLVRARRELRGSVRPAAGRTAALLETLSRAGLLGADAAE